MKQKENYWSRFADDFEKRNNYVAGKADVDLILERVAALKKLENVLELGCGNGTFSKVLALNSDSLLATDLSDEMVDVSKESLKNFKNIRVEKADCFNLPYTDKRFDTVFMANLIHIISDPGDAVQECKRVLRNGGALIMISYTQKGMKFRYKIGLIYRYLKTYGKPPKGGRNFGLEDAISLLKSYKFNIVEAELIGQKSKALFVKAVK